MYENCKVIAFDADDTLWVNETYFREVETKFAKILSKYETINKIDQELFKIEIKNLKDKVIEIEKSNTELKNNDSTTKGRPFRDIYDDDWAKGGHWGSNLKDKK